MYRRIPSALSISRIFIAALVILISSHLNTFTYTATLCLVVIAIATDALDGHLARRWNTVSETGYVLDTMGDRAIQLALLLIFLVRYSFSPLIVWLLIFRDIAIYAVRILSKDWLVKSRRMRPIFLFHTSCLRLWLGLYMLRDGLRVYVGSDFLNGPLFEYVQTALILVTILVSYYGLVRSFGWLIDREEQIM